MNIIQTIKLGFKKAKFSKGKSLFVVLPISFLIALIVIASSEALSLINVAHNSIFSSIEGQNQVLELNKNSGTFGSFAPPDPSSSSTDVGYTSTDADAITTIANVEKANTVNTLPISNIKSSDLFNGKAFKINSLAGINDAFAQIYTNKTFQYKEGEAIPIILNANDFSESYEDWQGKTEITIDLSRRGNPSTTENPIAAQNPAKTRAIPYNRNDLIGKEFTINFGGLTDIADIKQTPSASGLTFAQKTQDEINTEINTRKDAIAKYWDYDKISKPLSYKFVVVGIVEGADKTKAYIPEEFQNKLMQDYISNEINARNTTAIASTDWNSTYQGLVYDGVTLKSDSVNSVFASIRRQVTGQVNTQFNQIQNEVRGQGGGRRFISTNDFSLDPSKVQITFGGNSSSNYAIPGLVYQKDRTTSEVTGEYKSFDLKNPIPLESTTILIKINNVDNRDQVVSDLNSKGYTYQDSSKITEFKRLESYLNTALTVGSVIFMVITALFILINMAKFVSESRKEIGIFRAIGATKMKIRTIIISQSVIYIVLSIILGLLIGSLVVLGLSSVIMGYAQTFINSTVGGILTLSGSVIRTDFITFDYKMIAIYCVVLLVVTLIVSLWPAEQAARVSPVVAIKNE